MCSSTSKKKRIVWDTIYHLIRDTMSVPKGVTNVWFYCILHGMYVTNVVLQVLQLHIPPCSHD